MTLKLKETKLWQASRRSPIKQKSHPIGVTVDSLMELEIHQTKYFNHTHTTTLIFKKRSAEHFKHLQNFDVFLDNKICSLLSFYLSFGF